MKFLLAATGIVAVLLSYTQAAWSVHVVALSVFAASLITACRQEIWVVSKEGLLLGAMAAAGLVQLGAGVSVLPHATVAATAGWAASAALFAAAVSAFRAPGGLSAVLRIFAAFAGAVAFYALMQPYLGRLELPGLVSMDADYMVGPFQNRNTYAAFAELALPVAAWLALQRGGTHWWIAAALILASVLATGSRAGAALAIGEVFFLAVLSRRWLVGGVLGAVAGLALLASGETLLTRISYADPLVHRREIYASTLRMIEARPLSGWGLGAYADAYPRFATFDVGRVVNSAHNDWLEWAAEGGILFLSLAAGFFALALRRSTQRLWALGLPTVLIHSLVDFPMQRWGVMAWFLLLAAGLRAEAPFSPGKGPASKGVRYRLRSVASRFQRSHARVLPTSSGALRFSTSPELR